MKKLIALVLLFAMALTLCACGRKNVAAPAAEEKPSNAVSSLLSLFKRDKKDENSAPSPEAVSEPVPETPAPDLAAEAVALYNSGDYTAAFQ